jgi:hypothetical protein
MPHKDFGSLELLNVDDVRSVPIIDEKYASLLLRAPVQKYDDTNMHLYKYADIKTRAGIPVAIGYAGSKQSCLDVLQSACAQAGPKFKRGYFLQ